VMRHAREADIDRLNPVHPRAEAAVG
jgi:hypothetical protein